MISSFRYEKHCVQCPRRKLWLTLHGRGILTKIRASAVAKILRARASEHSSNFCEQFEQRQNFASTFKLNGTIRYPFYEINLRHPDDKYPRGSTHMSWVLAWMLSHCMIARFSGRSCGFFMITAMAGNKNQDSYICSFILKANGKDELQDLNFALLINNICLRLLYA